MPILKNVPIVGTVYGQWTVISTTLKNNGNKGRNTYWHVRCSCGKETFRAAHTLIAGLTKACMSCAKTKYGANSYIESFFNNRLQIRLRETGYECNLDIPYLEELFKNQNSRCAISGAFIKFERFKNLNDTTASLDRIDSSVGYIKGNVQWVHKDINMAKGTMSQSSFIKMCTAVHNYNNKIR